MDILKSISKIFKLEIILLLLVVLLFLLYDKQCFNFFIEKLDNNETCDSTNACDQVKNLKTQLKESNDKIDNITKTTTNKINDLKQKSNDLKDETKRNNLINNRISVLESKVGMNQNKIDDLDKSHSETKSTANNNKKVIGKSKASINTMSKMYHS
jgi:peptidoglycan hydrolase CwlO-like protein